MFVGLGQSPGVGTNVWNYFAEQHTRWMRDGHDAFGLIGYLDDRKLEGSCASRQKFRVGFVHDPLERDQRMSI
jgi:hypothetical protein